MTTVGVRELRQRASELLRLVESGETVQITDRGRPVAVLAPLPAGPLARMRASGETDPATTDEDFEAPLPMSAGAEPPSETLRRLRSDER
jgi:prevent-host-death family protein